MSFHTRVIHIHHGMRAWPRPRNHYDGRVCPTCRATVHGPEAQQGHQDRHLEEQEFQRRVVGWITELAKHVGITEEQVSLSFDPGEWAWGAEITGTEAEIEAAE